MKIEQHKGADITWQHGNSKKIKKERRKHKTKPKPKPGDPGSNSGCSGRTVFKGKFGGWGESQ